MNVATLKTERFIKGDTFIETIEFYEDEEETSPLNLSTNYDNIVMDIRNSPRESGKLYSRLELDDGIVISGAGSNVLTITLTPAITSTLKTNVNQITNTSTLTARGGNEYYRDIRFIKDGAVSTLLNGKYEVVNNITEIL